MRFSLVIATLNRVNEIETLLESLRIQTFQDFEVIIVDQNNDDRLARVINDFRSKFTISWLRSDVRNNSHARNLGLAVATGEIIAFPDDDCYYPPGVLAHVTTNFRARDDMAVLTGPAYSPTGELGSGRWHPHSSTITLRTVWTSVIAFNLFIAAAWIKRVGGFDEAHGVGARFGSAEETDLVIRIMAAGGQAFYDFDLRVVHPDKALSSVAVRRAFDYGTGLGRVLRKHHIGALTVANFFVRPLGGLALSLVRGNSLARDYYWYTFRGRLNGFMARP